jgi:hypothetical protein
MVLRLIVLNPGVQLEPNRRAQMSTRQAFMPSAIACSCCKCGRSSRSASSIAFSIMESSDSMSLGMIEPDQIVGILPRLKPGCPTSPQQ